MVSDSVRQLTVVHKQQQLHVRAALIAEIIPVWPVLSWEELDKTFPALLAAVKPIVQSKRAQSAELADLYVRNVRQASGVHGHLNVIRANPVDKRVATSLLVTSAVAAKIAARQGFNPEAAMRSAFVQTAGAMSRIALDAGRDTVVQTTRHDPHARGWQRVLTGKSCAFCEMLAGRGAVYKEDTADFQAHDHCGCSAEPVYQ